MDVVDVGVRVVAVIEVSWINRSNATILWNASEKDTTSQTGLSDEEGQKEEVLLPLGFAAAAVTSAGAAAAADDDDDNGWLPVEDDDSVR